MNAGEDVEIGFTFNGQGQGGQILLVEPGGGVVTGRLLEVVPGCRVGPAFELPLSHRESGLALFELRARRLLSAFISRARARRFGIGLHLLRCRDVRYRLLIAHPRVPERARRNGMALIGQRGLALL